MLWQPKPRESCWGRAPAPALPPEQAAGCWWVLGPVPDLYWTSISLGASPPHLEASLSIVWPPCLLVLPPPSLALSPLPCKDLVIANDGTASFLIRRCSEWQFGNVTEWGFLCKWRNGSRTSPKTCKVPNCAGIPQLETPLCWILAVNGVNNHDFGHCGGGTGLPHCDRGFPRGFPLHSADGASK